jgi:hypothetical protein
MAFVYQPSTTVAQETKRQQPPPTVNGRGVGKASGVPSVVFVLSGAQMAA